MTYPDSSYLKKQIIPYIGNKRRLLPLIFGAFRTVYPDLPPGLRFLDGFAGSGIVSRLGKMLNWQVTSNDWEPYAEVLNRAYVALDRSLVYDSFGGEQALRRTLDQLNGLPDPPEEQQYMARYYAPASFDPDEADPDKERVFYTRSNALKIDALRNGIDRLFPEDHQDPAMGNCRTVLLALLLVQAATHTNTSGVFKAYHRGFGGLGRDALSRILSPIALPFPELAEGRSPCEVTRADLGQMLKDNTGAGWDLVYLDPPYNQHQYGSNYHILNTLTLWDKIPEPLNYKADGTLQRKAGIRTDWKKTRSPFCSKKEAPAAFRELMDSLDARTTVISYSTDGIIPYDEMREICSAYGKISLVTNTYVKYRGGRQSNSRGNTNLEFLWILEHGRKTTPGDRKAVDDVLNRYRLQLMLKNPVNRDRLAEKEDFNGEKTVLSAGGKSVRFILADGLYLQPEDDLMTLDGRQCSELMTRIEPVLCVTRSEELEQLYGYLRRCDWNERETRLLARQIPRILRKLAHKKYAEEFSRWMDFSRTECLRNPVMSDLLGSQLKKLEELADKRF